MTIETRYGMGDVFYIWRNGKIFKCVVVRIEFVSEYDVNRCIEQYIKYKVYLYELDGRLYDSCHIIEQNLDSLCASNTLNECKLKVVDKVINN